MATEQEKNLNNERVWSIMALAVTRSVWDLLQDTVATLTPEIGKQVLEMLEKEMDLKISGDTPEAVIRSLAEYCAGSLEYCSKADVVMAEVGVKLVMEGTKTAEQFSQLKAGGVGRLFSHPVLCSGIAALARIGRQCRGNVQVDAASASTTITFEMI